MAYVLRFVARPSSVGTDPVSPQPPSLMFSSCAKFPNSVGIVPINPVLYSIYRLLMFFSNPMVEGNVPVPLEWRISRISAFKKVRKLRTQ